MNMFKSLLNAIPKNRSEIVNEFEIPEVTLSPYIWEEPEEPPSEKSESIVTESDAVERGTLSTDSSIPLSRAMTDSEIDYGRYKWLRHRRYSDPWDDLKVAMDAFPRDYLASLHSFQNLYSDAVEEAAEERLARARAYSDEMRLKMQELYDDKIDAEIDAATA
ncbi:uncharacterized protein LOC142977824 isoform X2 [Anticarsia gemmatalis]|uniref:uncharacterized protein LOC142977824 isoform X2 n=1 Tax=Anticarsia gemmatalis TaxID=129554 RepID=UPI003F76A5FC